MSVHMAWMTAPEAMARLGVKPQTLYAYVSRGFIAARPADRDPRQSLYSSQDVDALLRNRRAGRSRAKVAQRAIAWGDPVLETAIATVRDGRLLYRGQDAVALSHAATLEDVARLLWAAPDLAFPASAGAAIAGETPKARGLAYLARRAAADPPSIGRAPAALHIEGASLLAGLAAAFCQGHGGAPFHARLAAAWGLDADGGDLVRRALVLTADHELNPSTFAARVAASTGASLAAAALAGFATLTGPRHGEASARAAAYLNAAERDGAAAALADVLARAEQPPGFGHALYPRGDPRAAALLDALAPAGAVAEAIAAGEAATGAAANIDMALAALTVSRGLPRDAPFLIFAGGRMTGWIAHAIEQAVSGEPIRPRAHYAGP
ncbi:MAG: citrate synthase [Hyphomonadaceae bacterium]|nr:citrate synthase [Hyphomonadaceae bacterium]